MTLQYTQMIAMCNDIAQGKLSGITLQYTQDGFRVFSPLYGYAYSTIQGNQQIPPQEFSLDVLDKMNLCDGDLIGMWLNTRDNTVSVTFTNYTYNELEAQQYCANTKQIGYYSFSDNKTIYMSHELDM